MVVPEGARGLRQERACTGKVNLLLIIVAKFYFYFCGSIGATFIYHVGTNGFNSDILFGDTYIYVVCVVSQSCRIGELIIMAWLNLWKIGEKYSHLRLILQFSYSDAP